MPTIETPTTKLVPLGQGLALLLDPDVLREIGIEADTPVSITTDGRSIRISPAARRPSAEELEAAIQHIDAKWGKVMKKLAE